LEELLLERNQAEEDLADAAGRREEATAALYRLRSAADRLELRREAAVALAERLRAEPLRLPTVDDEQLRTTRERLSAVERALAEREGLPPAARALAEQGARLALSELEGETAEAVWLELEARRRALAAEVQRLQENPAAPPPAADPRLVAAGERLVRALAGAGEAGHRFEAPLRARVDAGGSRTGDAAGAL